MKFGADPIILVKELADKARRTRIMGRETEESRASMEAEFSKRMTFDAWVTISRLFQDLKDVEDNAAITSSRVADLHVNVDGKRCRSGCEVDPETGSCETLALVLGHLRDLGRDDLV